MLVLKLPPAILGCSDCDIVNACFLFVGSPALPVGVIFSGHNGRALNRQDESRRQALTLLVWRDRHHGAELRPFGREPAIRPRYSGPSSYRLFFVVVVALLILRVVARRPVPELIPERALGFGLAAGIALFLVGNFIATHLVGR